MATSNMKRVVLSVMHWRRLRLLMLASVIMVLVLAQGATTSLALPHEPLDPELILDMPFAPPSNGFDWRVPRRFGRTRDGIIDYHWIMETIRYDVSHVYPSAWPMSFYGCQTEEDVDNSPATTNTYKWELNGEFFIDRGCHFTYRPGFPAQGSYTVRLTVTDPAGNPVPAEMDPPYFEQQVVVKDYLIVSLGESFASGEGNPDFPQRYEPNYINGIQMGWKLIEPARWQDERCHRSAYAGPAQAALAIEAADPKTSVTFLSFACSGATIDTPLFKSNDSNKPLGTGLLGPYRGAAAPDNLPYNFSDYIPSQMDQLRAALVPPAGHSSRQIDALIISGGGNDMHFGDIAEACLLTDDCWNTAYVYESPSMGKFLLTTLVNRALGKSLGSPAYNIPANYDRLAAEVEALNPAPAHVYVTQYPDLTRDDDGSYCRMLDDILWPLNYALTPAESQQAAEFALGGLNEVVLAATQRHGWQFVDGLASYEVDPLVPAGTPGQFVVGPDGKGHGYCASDNWIRRADEAELLQGPLNWRAGTKGTLHPTIRGHQVYKERLLRYMLPNLNPDQPASSIPSFSTQFTDGQVTNISGTNGWFTGSCAGDTCYSKVVLQATATDDAGMHGASVSVNGTSGCVVTGVTCTTQLSSDSKQVTWMVEITADGVYRLEFGAQNSSGQTAIFGQEIKVDLHDPMLVAAGPFDVAEGDSVTLTAAANDPGGGMVAYAWDLDNDGTFETSAEEPTFSAAALDGPTSRTVRVRVTDGAGRTTAAETTVNVHNVAPTVGPIIVPVDPVLVNSQLNASADFTDPGILDTHTAEWDWGDGTTSAGTVNESDGSGSVSDTHIYETPGVYTLSLAVTDKDGDSGDSYYRYIVVYDPDGSFVSGGGWIHSPEGAYTPDPTLAGKASFGFVARYKIGANVPDGITHFQFKAGGLTFRSTEYEWLVVAGARAQFKGSGAINGGGDYGFMLTAVDGQVNGGGGTDKFRIKIWDKATGDVIYDNQIGDGDDANLTTLLGGGSIVIHK
jgi:PKD repeat protein